MTGYALSSPAATTLSLTRDSPIHSSLNPCTSPPRLSANLAYREVASAPNNKMIAETYTQVNSAIIAPSGPYTTLYTGERLHVQEEPPLGAVEGERRRQRAHPHILEPYARVRGGTCIGQGNVPKASNGETNRVTSVSILSKSVSGNMISRISRIVPLNGAITRSISITTPAPATRPRSIRRSLMNGLVLVIPQAALIPFLTAPNAAEEAQSRPRNEAVPVITRADATPRMVLLMNSVETGITSAIRSASSD